ncbi:hypothetical protein D3C75_460950 [compost metagenome]
MKLCPICKTNPLGRNKNCCSRACYSIYRSHTKTCVVCGKEFPSPPSSDTVTCGPVCSSENRRLKSDVLLSSLEKAHIAAATNPLTGRFETHVNAKEWVIQSPTGEIFRCRNLMLWLREHEDMLDGTVRQAWDGITKIKYSMQGKRKHPSRQWKGWRLLEWGE